MAKLAEVIPLCVQAVYTTSAVPAAPGTDLHRAMSLATEIAGPDATLWTVTDMLSTSGQLALTEAVVARSASEAAVDAAQGAPLDLAGITWKTAGLANTTAHLLSANRQWVRDFARGLCQAWNADGCDAFVLDPVNPTRNASALPADPIPPFPTVGSRTVGEDCSITLPYNLLFEPGSAQLRADAAEVLAKPLALMTENPHTTVSIVGHTASSGAYTAQELIELSKQRARTVHEGLVDLGVDGDRITRTVGVGDTQPLAEDIDAATGLQIPELAAAERRVELHIQGAPCSR